LHNKKENKLKIRIKFKTLVPTSKSRSKVKGKVLSFYSVSRSEVLHNIQTNAKLKIQVHSVGLRPKIHVQGRGKSSSPG
jgi:hypothetical protein